MTFISIFEKPGEAVILNEPLPGQANDSINSANLSFRIDRMGIQQYFPMINQLAFK